MRYGELPFDLVVESWRQKSVQPCTSPPVQREWLPVVPLDPRVSLLELAQRTVPSGCSGRHWRRWEGCNDDEKQQRSWDRLEASAGLAVGHHEWAVLPLVRWVYRGEVEQYQDSDGGRQDHVNLIGCLQASSGTLGASGRQVRSPVAGDLSLQVEVPAWPHEPIKGESIAVDGCCLTVSSLGELEGDQVLVGFDVVPGTLELTTIGSLQPGDRVHLEPALKAGDPIGGHYVQGHVDGTGQVRSIEINGDDHRVRIRGSWRDAESCHPAWLDLCLGSVADGFRRVR